MKINGYDNCPENSNTFVSGAGFTFFDDEGMVAKRIEVNVVNVYDIDVGCGLDETKSCLGAGSLELVIDGKKAYRWRRLQDRRWDGTHHGLQHLSPVLS